MYKPNNSLTLLFLAEGGEEDLPELVLYLSSPRKCVHAVSAVKVIPCAAPTASAQASPTHVSTQENKGPALSRDLRGSPSISVCPGSIATPHP